MKKFFRIVAIKGVGRYRVVIFYSGEARNSIENFLISANYDSLAITNRFISFSLDVHENIEEVVKNIKKFII